MTKAPAAHQVLAVLAHVARQAGPVPAAAIARDLGLPRSTTYQLLDVLQVTGFVVHLVDDRRYGLGVAAHELGTGYVRQEPLARLARVPLAKLVDRTGHTAHLAVQHGREVFYVIEERAPGRPPLVTDVGVRLPAHLTASGRALLAALSPAQVTALFPDPAAFVDRHDSEVRSLSALRRLLVEVRRAGFAVEEDAITPGWSSVAVAVLDHARHPVATIAVTFPSAEVPPGTWPAIADEVARTARAITARLGGPAARADAAHPSRVARRR